MSINDVPLRDPRDAEIASLRAEAGEAEARGFAAGIEALRPWVRVPAPSTTGGGAE